MLPRCKIGGLVAKSILWNDTAGGCAPAYRFHREFTALLQSLVTGTDDIFVDCSPAMLRVGEKGTTELDTACFLKDKLHLSREGYKKWGQCMSKAIGKTGHIG